LFRFYSSNNYLSFLCFFVPKNAKTVPCFRAHLASVFLFVITVVEARNLSPRTGETSKESPCDPYCVVSLVDKNGKRIDGSTKKTHVVKKSTHPVWDVTLTLYAVFCPSITMRAVGTPPHCWMCGLCVRTNADR